jgi:hypothetical protein
MSGSPLLPAGSAHRHALGVMRDARHHCSVSDVQPGSQALNNCDKPVLQHHIHSGNGFGVVQAQRGELGHVAVQQRLPSGVHAAEETVAGGR